MFTALTIFLTAVALFVIFVKPKWGSLIIWFVIFAYPHSLFFELLPLNMGIDDIFFIVFFLVVVIRRNIFEGVPVRFGYSFWIIATWLVIWTVASISGSTYSPSYYRPVYMKEVLKFVVYWGLFYAILHCIDNVDDLKKQLSFFSLAAVVGATLVVLSYYFPGQMAIFKSPIALWKKGIEYEARGTGAFDNANIGACVLVCCSMLIIGLTRLQRNIFAKIFSYSFVFILLLAVYITRSRAGLMCLVGTLFMMSIFSRSRKVVLLVVLAGLFVGFFATDITTMYKERIVAAYDPSTGAVGSSVAGRFVTWKKYFETATPQIYLFGQGAFQGDQRTGGESHSAYVSLLTVYGVGGVIWAIVAVTIFFKKVFILRRLSGRVTSAVGSGCLWALVAWGIFATSADAISAQFTRYVLFYLIVLLDRAAFFAVQQQTALANVQELEFGDEQELQLQSVALQVEESY
ncbi:MAG: O-antigen ligase family protein [Planctomycetota bacterium]|jgi:hypothetical protein